MVLFLDTSALAKLYITEDTSNQVEQAIQEADEVAVSVLALPELASIFFRRQQDGSLTEAQHLNLFRQALEDWQKLQRIPLFDDLAHEAAALARNRGLRGADAVHLASSALLSRERRGVYLLAFDQQLLEAAKGLVRVWTT